jgi:hypothetical protein
MAAATRNISPDMRKEPLLGGRPRSSPKSLAMPETTDPVVEPMAVAHTMKLMVRPRRSSEARSEAA